MRSYKYEKLKKNTLWDLMVKFNKIILTIIAPMYFIILSKIIVDMKTDVIIMKILLGIVLTVGIGIFAIVIISVVAWLYYFFTIKNLKDVELYINKNEIIYKDKNKQKSIKYSDINSIDMRNFKNICSEIIITDKKANIKINSKISNSNKIIKELKEKLLENQLDNLIDDNKFQEFINISDYKNIAADIRDNVFKSKKIYIYQVIVSIIIAIVGSIIFLMYNLDIGIIACYPYILYLTCFSVLFKQIYRQKEEVNIKKQNEYKDKLIKDFNSKFRIVTIIIGILIIIAIAAKAMSIF